MRKAVIARIIITALPLAVLFVLYGLWLFTEPPAYLESVFSATLLLALFSALYVKFVPKALRFFWEPDVIPINSTEQMRTTRRSGAREILVLLFAVCVFRIVIIVISYVFFTEHYGYSCTIFSAQRMWGWWSDAPYYMDIAARGYIGQSASGGTEHLTLAFLPFYSYVTRLFAIASGNYVRAGYFVSNISTVLGCIVLYALVKLDFDRKTARRAVRYFCILPAACLLYATMSDGLFFLLSVTALYLARKKYIPLAALAAALAAYTRIIGIVLLLPIAMEYARLFVLEQKDIEIDKWKFIRKQTFYGLSLLLVPMATGVYLLQNFLVSGNALQFMVYQNENWTQGVSMFYRTAGYQTDYLISSIINFNFKDAFGLWMPNIAAIFGSVTVMLIACKKMRASYIAYFFAYFIVSVSLNWLLSAPRYMICCYPVILGFALVTEKKYVDIPLTIITVAGLILYLYGFINGYPIY